MCFDSFSLFLVLFSDWKKEDKEENSEDASEGDPEETQQGNYLDEDL